MDIRRADTFASIALRHVTRQYPHILSHVFEQSGDARTPRTLHPVFYGSFDWHSCVHAYWLLATLLRRFPGLTRQADILTLFDTHLTPALIEGECAYFRRPAARGFERPYGWAWLLALQHTLRGTRWAPAVDPLARIIADRWRSYLPHARYPVRVGTHFNTAFALTLSAGYAEENDPPLLAQLRHAAHLWYAADQDCQAWEPAQDDFLSSALSEAVCMHRLAPDDTLWLDRFLPRLAHRCPATLFEPATVTDRTDGKIAHLDGLNLSRAWCWREIAAALPPGDPRIEIAHQAASAHLEASLPHVTGDFMGEHWLATFAALALLENALDR